MAREKVLISSLEQFIAHEAKARLVNAQHLVEEAYVELIDNNDQIANLPAAFRDSLRGKGFAEQESFLLTRDYLRYYLNLTLDDEVWTNEPG